MITFIIGLIVGANVGAFAIALVSASKCKRCGGC